MSLERTGNNCNSSNILNKEENSGNQLIINPLTPSSILPSSSAVASSAPIANSSLTNDIQDKIKLPTNNQISNPKNTFTLSNKNKDENHERIGDKNKDQDRPPSNSTPSSVQSTPKKNNQINQSFLPSEQHQHRTTSAKTVQNQQQQQQQLANTSANSSADECDEIKVYNEEEAVEEEQRNFDNLSEEKTEIIDEKPTSGLSSSHPFSVNNLMLFNESDPSNRSANSAHSAAAAAQATQNPFLQFGYHRSPFFNPAAALYSPELAHHFASWWPAAAAAGAAAFYHPAHNPSAAFHFSPAAAFSAAAAAASYQQQQYAAAAALSSFNPSLFLQQSQAASNVSHCLSPALQISNKLNNQSSSSPSTHSNQPKSRLPDSNQHSFNNSQNNSKHSINSDSHHHTQHNQPKIKNEMKHEPNGMFHHSENNYSQHSNSNSSHNHLHTSLPPPHIQINSKPKNSKPHIKKPLNAFMLFMKEQRSQVVNECTLKESAAINQILGRKWHELERSEQAKYYEMAREERLKHLQMYPGWSARENYGLKKKRRRKQEKVINENGELPRKCRARYGLDQINLWCKPCRRKKKCIRFASLEDGANKNDNVNNGILMSQNNQMYSNKNMAYGAYGDVPNENGSGAGSAGVGSAGSLNGENSEDDYEDDDDNIEDDLGSEDETDTDDDPNENDDSVDPKGNFNNGAFNGYNNNSFYHNMIQHPHPNKKPNLDIHPNNQHPQQIQHNQMYKSPNNKKQQIDIKHNVMQHIQQMQHPFLTNY